MIDLGIAERFQLTRQDVTKLLETVRGMHSPWGFRKWGLTIDRLQYLMYMIGQLGLIRHLSAMQQAAIFFYVLCLNCQPEECNEEIRTRRCLEGNPMMHLPTMAFLVLSSVTDNPLFAWNYSDWK
jgi:hypothetical protein